MGVFVVESLEDKESGRFPHSLAQNEGEGAPPLRRHAAPPLLYTSSGINFTPSVKHLRGSVRDFLVISVFVTLLRADFGRRVLNISKFVKIEFYSKLQIKTAK